MAYANTPLESDIANTGHRFRDEVRHAMHLVSDTGRKVKNALHTASDEISNASEKSIGEIRTNPVRSSIVALGVGMFIGMLLRR